MERAILRFTGPGAAPPADVARIRAMPGVNVIDASAPRMVLVDMVAEARVNLASLMPGWLVVSEQVVPLPDTREKVRRLAPRKRSGNG